MAPYFGCYRCDDTKTAFEVLDMDKDGYVDWIEFQLYLVWALHEYSNDIATKEDLINICFTKGILPTMRGLVVSS